jgi:tetratricopeptide (TPR) repeat protein
MLRTDTGWAESSKTSTTLCSGKSGIRTSIARAKFSLVSRFIFSLLFVSIAESDPKVPIIKLWQKEHSSSAAASEINPHAEREKRAAIEFFQQAGSHDCQVSFYIGLARYRLAESDEAIRRFQSSTECDPLYLPARAALAEAYAQLGDMSRALTAFDAALQIDPNNTDALRGASRIHLDAQSNDKAVPLLEKLVSIESSDTSVKNHLGAAYAATGRFNEAEARFTSVLAVQPSDLSTMTGLANVMLKTSRNQDAVLLLQKAVNSSTPAYEPLFLLGSAYNSSGESEKAVTLLEKAVKLAPNDQEGWYQLATAYGKVGRLQERQSALTSFKLAKESSHRSKLVLKETAAAIENVGALVKQGDLRQAARILEASLERERTNSDLLFRTAGVYFDLPDYERARTLVNEAIRLAPSEWQYEYLRGLIEKGDRRFEQASSAFETALQLNPKAPDVHNQLGDLELRTGNAAGAVKHFKHAAELDPRDSSYRLDLEAALAQLPNR